MNQNCEHENWEKAKISNSSIIKQPKKRINNQSLVSGPTVVATTMSSHSGTIGRSSGRSITTNGAHMRRQRSVEWHHAQGYSSSDDDERGIHGTINPSFDSQLLAQLIAQSQELSNKCKYKVQLHSI